MTPCFEQSSGNLWATPSVINSPLFHFDTTVKNSAWLIPFWQFALKSQLGQNQKKKSFWSLTFKTVQDFNSWALKEVSELKVNLNQRVKSFYFGDIETKQFDFQKRLFSDANHLREVAEVIASVSLTLLIFAKGKICTCAEQPAPELNQHLWATPSDFGHCWLVPSSPDNIPQDDYTAWKRDVAAGWSPQSKMLCGSFVVNISSFKKWFTFTDSQLASVLYICAFNPLSWSNLQLYVLLLGRPVNLMLAFKLLLLFEQKKSSEGDFSRRLS